MKSLHTKTLQQIRTLLGFQLLLLTAFSSPSAAADSVFGKRESGGDAALIGIIYDLKQDQKRKPTGVTPKDYSSILFQFMDKNWDEAELNRFFRAARPVYATQVFIPMMGAGEAPKAFGVENVIKPAVWVVHYKGQVSPPESGNYRFLCFADDVMAVAVGGKTVCYGARPDMRYTGWKSSMEEKGGIAGNGELTYGDWIPMKKNEPIDLDVLVGERPGGDFCAFLLYERQGANYPKQGNTTLYPVFKLAPYDSPVTASPLVYRTPELWKGHQ
jgi:hypothetical protein